MEACVGIAWVRFFFLVGIFNGQVKFYSGTIKSYQKNQQQTGGRIMAIICILLIPVAVLFELMKMNK